MGPHIYEKAQQRLTGIEYRTFHLEMIAAAVCAVIPTWPVNLNFFDTKCLKFVIVYVEFLKTAG